MHLQTAALAILGLYVVVGAVVGALQNSAGKLWAVIWCMWQTCSINHKLSPFGLRKFPFFYNFRRNFSEQSDDSLIILNPRQAGILRAKPRRYNKKVNGLLKIPDGVPPLESFETSLKNAEPVVSAIHSHRPESLGITELRFNSIKNELVKGFKKAHLEDYCRANNVGTSLYKKLTKPNLAQFIMANVWKRFIRNPSSQQEGSVLTENILDLSEQELVLVLGGNGRLLREWSKSGARIAISPYHSQIIVTSTQETFDWISASLSHFLESVKSSEFNIAELKTMADPVRFPEYLATIQKLTDTYFRGLNDDSASSDTLIIYSAGKYRNTNANVAKRLMIHLIQPALVKAWKPSAWWFNTDPESQETSTFQSFDDSDSLEWMERMRKWSRWETLKIKPSLNELKQEKKVVYKLDSLHAPEFASAEANHSTETSLSAQLEHIVHKLVEKHPVKNSLNGENVSATLTVTPGFVLHEHVEKSALPHVGIPKTFTSNIPFVANFASTLPLYSKDTRHEDMVEELTKEKAVKSNNSSEPDLWADILNLGSHIDESGGKVFANRRKDLDLQSNLRLIQMKFVPDPRNGSATEFPPVEAWAELPPFGASHNSLLTKIPRVVAVPIEASSYISLPNFKSDLKFTFAHTYPIEISSEVEDYFMRKCRFGRVGPIDIKPEIEFNFGDRKEPYLYHSSAYVTLAELDFRNHLLQLSQVEGGKLGGRKVEASIIEHSQDAKEFEVTLAAKKTVQNILSFVGYL